MPGSTNTTGTGPCAFLKCPNAKARGGVGGAGPGSPVSYFKLPKDPAMRQLWIEHIGNPALTKLTKKELKSCQAAICSLHFSDVDFINPGTKNKLTSEAIPLPKDKNPWKKVNTEKQENLERVIMKLCDLQVGARNVAGAGAGPSKAPPPPPDSTVTGIKTSDTEAPVHVYQGSAPGGGPGFEQNDEDDKDQHIVLLPIRLLGVGHDNWEVLDLDLENENYDNSEPEIKCPPSLPPWQEPNSEDEIYRLMVHMNMTMTEEKIMAENDTIPSLVQSRKLEELLEWSRTNTPNIPVELVKKAFYAVDELKGAKKEEKKIHDDNGPDTIQKAFDRNDAKALDDLGVDFSTFVKMRLDKAERTRAQRRIEVYDRSMKILDLDHLRAQEKILNSSPKWIDDEVDLFTSMALYIEMELLPNNWTIGFVERDEKKQEQHIYLWEWINGKSRRMVHISNCYEVTVIIDSIYDATSHFDSTGNGLVINSFGDLELFLAKLFASKICQGTRGLVNNEDDIEDIDKYVREGSLVRRNNILYSPICDLVILEGFECCESCIAQGIILLRFISHPNLGFRDRFSGLRNWVEEVSERLGYTHGQGEPAGTDVPEPMDIDQ